LGLAPRGAAAGSVGLAERGAVVARTRERCGSRAGAPGFSLIFGRSDIVRLS
jgi:hypothetical protein